MGWWAGSECGRRVGRFETLMEPSGRVLAVQHIGVERSDSSHRVPILSTRFFCLHAASDRHDQPHYFSTGINQEDM